MKCPGCPTIWSIDIMNWNTPSPCTECKCSSELKDKKQMNKYKEVYQLLTKKGGTEMPNENFDYISVWCLGEMNGVFGST